MLDFDAGKLVVIGVVALVVIGPKELPRVLRQVGSTVSKLRRMASDFQSQFMDAMREAEMADVKEEMNKIAESAKIDVAFDPVRDIRNQIGSAISGETSPHGPVPATAVADLPGGSVDLSALEKAEAPAAADTALADGGLVGAGIGPAPEIAESSGAPATATLDDVRQALDEKLDDAKPKAPQPDQPVKEHSA